MSTGKLRDLTESEIADMLALLDPANREIWVRMAMAVKSELGDSGFDVWDNWSRTDTGGYKASAAKSVWKSAKVGPVTVGSLVHLAKEYGYVIDNEDVPQLTPEQIAEREESRKAARKKFEDEVKAEQKRVRDQSRNIWDDAQPCETHPYLARKCVKSYGLRVGKWPLRNSEGKVYAQHPNTLIIPVVGADGTIHTLQGIFAEPPKGYTTDRAYLPGGKKSGGFHMIGSIGENDVVAFCEGYATGATIHQLTGWTVVVCFDSSNLENVAYELREFCTGKRVIICGDNDQLTVTPTVTNPGLTVAKKTANTINAAFVVPEFDEEVFAANTHYDEKGKPSYPSDFNDLAQLQPIDDARIQLLGSIAAKRPKLSVVPTARAEPPVTRDDEVERVRLTEHYQPLGYNKGKYFYLSTATAQIVELTPTGHSKGNLLQLAPLDYWQMEYGTKNGINWELATDHLMGQCHAAGIFSPSKLRGRGAWSDKGRAVYHFGSHLLIDGAERETWEIESRFVYERLEALPEPDEIGLTDDEGEQLLEISSRFRWHRPVSAALLLGFVALAPLCGALAWRPHVWLTGGAGCGKTTVLSKYVRQLLQSVSVYAQGDSSEAGIRQKLKGDALPVLFDESEQNTERESQRVQAIIAMIRQSSSDSQATTLKGTVNGDSLSYHIRSMFCLSSIQVGIKHQADVERLTVLTLRNKVNSTSEAEEWEKLKEALYWIERDPTISGRLLRRVLDNQQTIMTNVETFKRAGARLFGTVRDGDQFGTLLAGCYSMLSTEPATDDVAEAFIKYYDWTQIREVENIDESELVLQTILNHPVRLPTGITTTIYRVWMEARGDKQGIGITATEAKTILEGIGIKGEPQRLCIGTSDVIEKAFRSTAFAADWRGLISRLDGVNRSQTVRLNGRQQRCVAIPAALVDENRQLTIE